MGKINILQQTFSLILFIEFPKIILTTRQKQ